MNGNLTICQAAASRTVAVVTTLTSNSRDSSELFVGRAEQVRELLSRLKSASAMGESSSGPGSAVSVIVGMGGIGKTALARHTAILAAKKHWFRGGVPFVDLRGYDPDDDPVHPGQVFEPMLRALGVVDKRVPASPDDQAAMYHQVLDQLAEQGRRVLVVLDNASAGKQVIDLLPQHPAHRALVTTRDTLTLPGAYQLDLDVLTTGEALHLLNGILDRRQAGDDRVAQNVEAAERLVSVCGALPLAVEMIASTLADEPSMTTTIFLAELTAADGHGVHRIRHGERALTTVFDVSWRRLQAREPEAGELLPLLALNPGPDFHTDAAASLAGQSSARVAPWLRVLRQASLLRCIEGRWSIHDVIRLHARDHLDIQHQGPATRRLLEHYQQTAKSADEHLRALPGNPVPERFAGRQDALAWFDVERANLVAAVAQALDTRNYDLTTDLAVNLSVYLPWRRHLTDWVNVTENGLVAAKHLDTVDVLAKAWTNRGTALQHVRRFAEAVSSQENAVACRRKLSDPQGLGEALGNLGVALRLMGRLEDAISVNREAADIFRETGDRRSEGMVWNNLGNVQHDMGRIEEAITAFRQDIAICREIRDRHGEGMALSNLGSVQLDAGQFAEALTTHQTSVTIYRETGDRYGEGLALCGCGLVLHEMRQFTEAVIAHQTAATILGQTRDRHEEGMALEKLGLAWRELGRPDDAKDAWQQAVVAFRETGDTHAERTLAELLNTLP